MSRKYGQKGYQDHDRPRKQRTEAPRPREDRLQPSSPRGRGLGAPRVEVFTCAVCGHRGTAPAPTATTTSCASCGGDLHTCTHCRHFDTSARFQCRQEIDGPVATKTATTECNRFEAKVSMERGEEKPAPSGPRSAFDDLFEGI